nr:immunoglobulin light chain junction region [Macaca mulatta]
CQKYSSTPLSF